MLAVSLYYFFHKIVARLTGFEPAWLLADAVKVR
jgi:hypothetical protein